MTERLLAFDIETVPDLDVGRRLLGTPSATDADVRAGMIAQTEMNAAYNAGRKQLGIDMGFNEKAWDPDGTACEEICVPNVLDGWIDMDEEFESGDSEPPGHPNCDCSLNVRFNADAE